MALMYSYRFLTFLVLCLLFCTFVHGGRDKLTPDFYGQTCKNLQAIVRTVVEQEIQSEARVGAFLLRLFFHDCFVQGCDASILLDDVLLLLFTGEKTAGPNVDLDRAYDIIDKIKAQVEASCKATVSCADIIALAARDSVNVLGGPTWNVFLGRLDSRTASKDEANSALPGPDSSLSDLVAKFNDKHLSPQDMTALSGAHTIGKGRCSFFRNRIYNDKNIDAGFAALRQKNCSQFGTDDDPAPNDVGTPTDKFDNMYYVDLVNRMGLFHSDQELFNGGSMDSLVLKYSKDQTAFFTDFATSMVRLGALEPPASVKAKGEVRLNCRRVNSVL